jgi:hypothetical protein
MAKRTVASGGVAAQPLPKSLLKRRPELHVSFRAVKGISQC